MVSIKVPKQPLVMSTRFQDDYRLIERIGDGGYATVFLAETKQYPHTRVAVKKMTKHRPGHTPDSLTTRYLQEARLLAENQHKHILKFIAVYNEEDYFYLVTEYLHGDDLFSQINTLERRFHEHEIRKVITSILLAIKHLHDRNIIHRDLKLENIMLVSPPLTATTAARPAPETVKVIDFGFATEVDGNNATGGMGTIYYAAPEIFKRDNYGKAIDLWSLGVLTYCLLYGRYPFYSESKTELAHQILTAQYRLHHYSRAREFVSEELKSFLMGLLVVDPTQRMTVDQALKHPWIRPSISFTTAAFVIRACKKWKNLYQQKQQLRKLQLLEQQQQQQLALQLQLQLQVQQHLAQAQLQMEEIAKSFSTTTLTASPVKTESVDFTEEASISQKSQKKVAATSTLFTHSDVIEDSSSIRESARRMAISPELEVEKRYTRRLWYHMKQVFSTISTFIPINSE